MPHITPSGYVFVTLSSHSLVALRYSATTHLTDVALDMHWQWAVRTSED